MSFHKQQTLWPSLMTVPEVSSLLQTGLIPSLQARSVVRCMREHDMCVERRVIWQGAGGRNRSGRGWA